MRISDWSSDVCSSDLGLGHGFLDQDVAAWRHVIDTNITGTLLLLQPVLKQMVARGRGKVLITGSIAGHLAGSFQAVYNGSKAFKIGRESCRERVCQSV